MLRIYVVFILLIICSCNSSKTKEEASSSNPIDSVNAVEIIKLDNLPDSLKPEHYELNSKPSVFKVNYNDKVPANYRYKNKDGEIIQNKLISPRVNLAPVLRDENNQIILDTLGEPFLMGNVGKSNFQVYNTDHGIPMDYIAVLFKDKEGNIWIGTLGGGVCRYNGLTFKTFTHDQGLAGNRITAITQDKQGNLWFGSQGGGLSRYDGHYFKTFTTKDDLPSMDIVSLLCDLKGNIWIATPWGLSVFDGKKFNPPSESLPTDHFLKLFEDSKGNIWIATYGKGVIRYNGLHFKVFTKKDGLPNDRISTISEDDNGLLWFGSFNDGVSSYDGKRFANFGIQQGFKANVIYESINDKKGNIWFATESGLIRFDGKRFSTFTIKEGLPVAEVNCFTLDHSGYLWIGTINGLCKYDDGLFTNYSSDIGLQGSEVQSLAQDQKGNIWIGTYENGLVQFNGKQFTNFSKFQGLPGSRVQYIYVDKTNNFWLANSEGFATYFDGSQFTFYSYAQFISSRTSEEIIEDKDGRVWFSSYNEGISILDGKGVTKLSLKQGLKDMVINALALDHKGNVWIGTRSGLSCYNGHTLINFLKPSGLIHHSISDIFKDKDHNIWIGTNKGISFLSKQKIDSLGLLQDNNHPESKINERIKKQQLFATTLFTSFSTKDGIPDNFIRQIKQLPNGKMVLGSNLGITVFDAAPRNTQSFDELKNIEIFNSQFGYPVKEIKSQGAMLIDRDGAIWAATRNKKTGLVKFDYNKLRHDSLPPLLSILNIKINEVNINWQALFQKGLLHTKEDSAKILLGDYLTNGIGYSQKQVDKLLERFGNLKFDSISPFNALPIHLRLPYQHNQISFDYAALQHTNQHLVEYKYMLEGYDKSWSPSTNKSNVSYGNMDEGKYIFKLKARVGYGPWSAPIQYEFRVLPPWYRTWWAYLCYVALFLLGLRAFSTFRERELRRKNEKLERTVEERTKELVIKNQIIEKEKERSDELLLNILPEEVAEELKNSGESLAKQYNDVTVLFTDFVNFTGISENLSPTELVKEIHKNFTVFDHIMEKYGVEKIKTIGDAYLAVCGLPKETKDHAERVVQAALDIQEYIKNNPGKFEVRIGLHSGHVVAGIVGVKKYAYDIWGDTVNSANRMETNGAAGKINISEETYQLVKDKFKCAHRGKINAKGKGEMDMYYVLERK